MAPDEIDERVAALYGDIDWREASGLLHVAAIHGPSGRILKIGPDAPPSPIDRFALGLARARADVLVTTGRILRSEPDLVHRYSEASEEDEAIAEWRRRAVGRAERPRLLVLSETGRFPIDHPAFGASQGVIWTSAAGAAAMGRPPAGFDVVQAEADRDTARDAIASCVRTLAAERTDATVLLEAGPSTSNAFYEKSGASRVDELLLSRFDGAIAPAAQGPVFVPEYARASLFGAARSRRSIDEASGSWGFERYRVD